MNASTHPAIGMSIDELSTPALVLDLDAFESNCATLASHFAERGVEWRPHTKAHKSPVLARRMIDAGAIGVTCAKVGEVEAMVAGGIEEVLLANQPSTEDAWRRMAALQRSARVFATVDDQVHVRAAEAAGDAIGVSIPLIIEVDIGMNRAGVRTAGQAVDLARMIVDSGCEFAGVMGYEGHLLTIESPDEKKDAIESAVGIVVAAAEAIRAASIDVGIVSSGGTGSYQITAEIDGVTEIQAGGGCLMDRFYRELCGVDLENALFLVSSVASRPQPNLAILDAGWKALPDRGMPPICHDLPGATVSLLYAEHLRLDLSGQADPQIGDRVVMIPGYSDATTVLHNEFLGVRSGVVEEVIPLTARGALQ